MIMKIFVSLFLIVSLSINCPQKNDKHSFNNKVFEVIKTTTVNFIDSLGEKAINKFGYYVVRIANIDTNLCKIDFSISCILNSEHIELVHPKVCFYVDTLLILVRSEISTDVLTNKFSFKVLPEKDELLKKFLKNGTWSGEPVTGIYQYRNGKLNCQYEPIDFKVPKKYSIIDIPDGNYEFYSYPHHLNEQDKNK